MICWAGKLASSVNPGLAVLTASDIALATTTTSAAHETIGRLSHRLKKRNPDSIAIREKALGGVKARQSNRIARPAHFWPVQNSRARIPDRPWVKNDFETTLGQRDDENHIAAARPGYAGRHILASSGSPV
jgi:hypothetical protein